MPSIQIEPAILHWAIERSGKSVEELSRSVKRLSQWLSGATEPTLPQLEGFANATNVPIGYMFLPEPPDLPLPIPDFRTKDGSQPSQPSQELLETIYELERRQAWMRDYLIELGNEPIRIVGSKSMQDIQNLGSIRNFAQGMRKELGLPIDWQVRANTPDEALRLLRRATEQLGILLFFNSGVGHGSNRPLSVEEFRGFVLVDEYAPLIFVNAGDAVRAQLFTMAHELVHIWLGKSGVVDVDSIDVQQEIEVFCNRVAAEIVAPEKLFRSYWEASGIDNARTIASLARQFKVSEVVIARRALNLGYLSKEAFFAFYANWRKVFTEIQQRPKSGKSGGNFYRTVQKRLGERFSRAVVSAVQSENIGYREAFALTGLTGKTFTEYANRLLESKI